MSVPGRIPASCAAQWIANHRPIPVIDETFEYEGYVIVLLQATTGKP